MAFPAVLFGLPADEEPHVRIERAEFLLHFQKGPRIRNRRADFQPVADDSGITEQSADFLIVVARHFRGIKSVKHFVVPRAFFQNRIPAQPRLRTLQNQELKPFAVVVNGHTPLLVVIRNVQFIRRPGTTHNALFVFLHEQNFLRES